ncbi:hypothetical protein CRENBAI_005588 [Crenichthys baileyi]|uniref:Uncharacterized protein n=1 Tax=Crenichthys baileyi TaxID=28760 RepID=A0AAV9S8P8_9TELE
MQIFGHITSSHERKQHQNNGCAPSRYKNRLPASSSCPTNTIRLIRLGYSGGRCGGHLHPSPRLPGEADVTSCPIERGAADALWTLQASPRSQMNHLLPN